MNSISPFDIVATDLLEPFSLKNNYMEANFDADGYLTGVTHLSSARKTQLAINFVRYGTRKGPARSGAYLFLPDGPAQPILPQISNQVRIIRGPLRSQAQVVTSNVLHTITLNNSPGISWFYER